MKINRLDKDAVRSTKKLDQRVTTLTEKELKSAIGGEEGCNCSYRYGSSDQTVLS